MVIATPENEAYVPERVHHHKPQLQNGMPSVVQVLIQPISDSRPLGLLRHPDHQTEQRLDPWSSLRKYDCWTASRPIDVLLTTMFPNGITLGHTNIVNVKLSMTFLSLWRFYLYSVVRKRTLTHSSLKKNTTKKTFELKNRNLFFIYV